MKIFLSIATFIISLTGYSQITFLDNINQTDSIIKANSIKSMFEYVLQGEDTLLSFIEFYNNEGKVVKQTSYDVKGKDTIQHSKIVYQYDDKTLTSVIKYDKKNEIEFEESFTYSSKDKIETYKLLKRGDAPMIINYEYDVKGALKAKKYYESDKISSNWEYVYHEDGKLHKILINGNLWELYEYGEAEYGGEFKNEEKIRRDKIISYDNTGEVTEEFVIDYNKNGTVMQQRQNLLKEKKSYKYTYRYDKYKNPLSRNVYGKVSYSEFYTYNNYQLLKEHKIVSKIDQEKDTTIYIYEYHK